MKGKLYGIGVGPGDPEMLTLKAVRLIRECPVIVCPGKVPEKTVAYNIVVQAVPEIAGKQVVGVDFLMTKDPQLLHTSHRAAADRVEEILDRGEDVAFLTLGDATVYATYMYVHHFVEADGYDTQIISGIPSFCAVAARLNMSLTEKEEELHVIPSSYGIEHCFEYPGTKVLMKAASKMSVVKKCLQEHNAQAVMIENCGMPNERIHLSTDDIPEQASYYSLIIVKENKS